MSFERLPSFLGSLCLHLGIFALVLFWPASIKPLPNLDRVPMHSGLVTIGKPGKAVPDAKKATPEAQKGRPDQPETAPQRPQPDKPEQKQLAQVETPTPPQKKPDVKPIEKPVDKPVKKPEPDATPIPKEPEKKKPVQNATQSTPPAKNATKQTKPDSKPAAKPKDDLASALADMDKQAGDKKGKGNTGAKTGAGKGQSLSSGLDELKKQVGGAGDDAAGSGPGGKGGDGAGILGAYGDSVVSRVRPNWSWPGRTDRKNFTAVVTIKIAADGTIESARITTPSGNSYFDATVLRAVMATQTLEKPPRPDLMEIDISFTPEGLGGH